jgi:CubicO group peptidase (beta-lactamase class C family)
VKFIIFISVFSILSINIFSSEKIDLNSSQCLNFLDFSTKHIDDSSTPFNTDGLVIYKNGKIQFEFYESDPKYLGKEGGIYLKDTPHILWSASKTITSTIMARAIFEEVQLPNKEILNLNTKLFTLLPSNENYLKSAENNLYNNITIEHLISMSSNFKWNESYDSNIKDSTFLPMLYNKKGHKDMLSYALGREMMTPGPGNIWNYDGGNSIRQMGVLKTIYGEAQFNSLPWDLLFNPLQMENVVFERDEKGIFIGNSYVYMRPIDMIKFGLLYLNNGNYNGLQMLDESWVSASSKIADAVTAEATPLKSIQDEGVYSKRAFWLNQKAKGYGPEFPNSPKDMYFAGGHYGQLIIIIPSEKMIIARTGHDVEYWSKIDSFVSKAVACFKN